MPYIVQDVRELCRERGEERPTADVIGEFLSQAETEGFKLISTVSEHIKFLADGSKSRVAPMLILYREEPI